MLFRTYINKINTIIKDNPINCGINPISELVYSNDYYSRMLIYFDTCKIKELYDNKVCPNIDKFRHYLKITNASSIDFTQVHCNETSSISEKIKVRATSFDLIFFLIPQDWDGGKGFDYSTTFFNQGYYGKNCPISVDSRRLYSEQGSNWFQARNGWKWAENGVYDNITLSTEYDKFSSNEGSAIIIGRQHFDIGNENINLDITEIFNKFMFGEIPNYGIGIAYTPMTELNGGNVENYCGFLTHKTNTFFEPYIETYYDDYIDDSRSHFIMDKNNKLYLYCNIGGECDNLDELPTCEVNGKQYEVKQYSKGIYYIDINISRKEYKPNTMLFDTWGNIKYQGVEMDDIELDFVVKSNNLFFNIGNQIEESIKLEPTLYGIQHREKIKRGDVRKVVVNPRVKYSKNLSELVDNMEYRLYIKDGEREIDIIQYEKVHKTMNENFFLIDTSMLIPQRYYIDIKFRYNMEIIMHHNVLNFDIVDDLNNKYV